MADGISPNPLNDISKAYLEVVAKINKDEEEKIIQKWDDSSVSKVDPDLVLKVEDKQYGYDKKGRSLNPVDIEKRKRKDDDLFGSPGKKAKIKTQESYSDWRNDLREIVAEPEEKAEKEVSEKKGIKNKVVINPKLGEAVAEIGGQLLEIKEIDRQVVDPAERKEDPSIKSKENRQKMLKKQVLLRKLQAVRQGAGADITASYEPDGEVIEGYAKPKGMEGLPKGSKVRVKKGVKVQGKHVKEATASIASKANTAIKNVERKKELEKVRKKLKAMRKHGDSYHPFLHDPKESYDPLEDAIEYFYEEGINEEGFDQLIEEIGLEEFVNFIDGGVVELSEERAARKASVRAKKYDVVKKEVDKADAARKASKKGEYAPSYAKKETDVTVYDDKPTAKKKAPAKKVAPSTKSQARTKAQSKGTGAPGLDAHKERITKHKAGRGVKKPVTKKVVKAVAKVKKTQPKKKATKQGLGDKIRTAYKAGVKRHRKATQGARVFGKGFAAGAKKAVKFAKDVKKVVSEEELDERLGGKGYKPRKDYAGRTVSGDWENSDRGGGHKWQKRVGKPVKKKSPTYQAYVLNKEEAVNERTLSSYIPSDRQGEASAANREYVKAQLKKKEDESTKNRGDLRKRDAGKIARQRLYNKKIMSIGEVNQRDYELEEKVKGQDTEMRRAASAERRSGETKKLSPSKGRANVGKMARDIRFYDKRTKETKPSVLGMVTDEVVLEKDLNAAERRALPNKEFALPGKGKGPEGKQAGSYPIPDKTHARMALAMVAKHGTPEKKEKVRAAVAKKFPGIQQEAIDRQAKDRKKLSQPHSVSGSRRDHSHDVDSALTDHVPRKGKGRVRPASKKEMRVAAMREDKAFNYVLDKLRKKHGKDAVITKDSPKPKPASAAQKAKVAAERKKRQEADNKAFADRAKKAGYKNPQDYANVVARYGGEDNYKKGRGLGT